MAGWHRLAIAGLATLAMSGPARSELACEQVLAVGQATLKYRNEGYSMQQVLSGLKEVEQQGKLTPVEMETLRRVVQMAFLEQATPEEMAQECVRARDRKKR